jgi:pimeloyl-ACP methyl ester carboxylesterase
MRFFRTSDGAELAFEEGGSGAACALFVHGWQADHSVWNDLIAALGLNVRTIAVDLRGSGASRDAPGPYNLERFSADLRELIVFLGAAPVFVVGHSMGATIALRLAVDAPELVHGLVLIAPIPASGAGFSPKGEAYLRSTAGDPAMVRDWLARTFTREPGSGKLDRLCAAAAATTREVALESFESWAHADFADATSAIAVQTLVIAPVNDAPEKSEAKVAALLRDARCIVLDNTAHYAILERPAVIAALVRDVVFRLAPEEICGS